MDDQPKPGRPRTRRGARGSLAEAMRAVREARGWTQEQAAHDLGITRSRLAMIETGAFKPRGLALRFLLETWIPRSLEGREEDKKP